MSSIPPPDTNHNGYASSIPEAKPGKMGERSITKGGVAESTKLAGLGKEKIGEVTSGKVASEEGASQNLDSMSFDSTSLDSKTIQDRTDAPGERATHVEEAATNILPHQLEAPSPDALHQDTSHLNPAFQKHFGSLAGVPAPEESVADKSVSPLEHHKSAFVERFGEKAAKMLADEVVDSFDELQQDLVLQEADGKHSAKKLVECDGKTYVIRLRRDKEGQYSIQLTTVLGEGAQKTAKTALILETTTTLKESTLIKSGIKLSLKLEDVEKRVKSKKHQLFQLKKAHPKEYAQAMRALDLEKEAFALERLYAEKEPKKEPAIKTGVKAFSSIMKGKHTEKQLLKKEREEIAEKLVTIQTELEGLSSQELEIRALKESYDEDREATSSEMMQILRQEKVKGMDEEVQLGKLLTKHKVPYALSYEVIQRDGKEVPFVPFCAHGDAESLIARTTLTPRQKAMRMEIIKEIAISILAIHDLGYCATDLKPQNAFLAENPITGEVEACLGDLGGKPVGSPMGPSTPDYDAPERKIKNPTVEKAGDLWALGVTAYTFYHGMKKNAFDKEKAIHKSLDLSQPEDRFISALIKDDPTERISEDNLLPLLEETEQSLIEKAIEAEAAETAAPDSLADHKTTDLTDQVAESRGTDQAAKTVESKVDEVADGMDFEDGFDVGDSFDIEDMGTNGLPSAEATILAKTARTSKADELPSDQLPDLTTLLEDLSQPLEEHEATATYSPEHNQVMITVPKQISPEATKEQATALLKSLESTVEPLSSGKTFAKLSSEGKIVVKDSSGKVVLGKVATRKAADEKTNVENLKHIKESGVSEAERSIITNIFAQDHFLKKCTEFRNQNIGDAELVAKIDTKTNDLKTEKKHRGFFEHNNKTIVYDIPHNLLITANCQTIEEIEDILPFILNDDQLPESVKSLIKEKLLKGKYKDISAEEMSALRKEGKLRAEERVSNFLTELKNLQETQKEAKITINTNFVTLLKEIKNQPTLEQVHSLAKSFCVDLAFSAIRMKAHGKMIEAAVLEEAREQKHQFIELLKKLSENSHIESARVFKEDLERFWKTRENLRQEVQKKQIKEKQPRTSQNVRGT